jgi:HD domain
MSGKMVAGVAIPDSALAREITELVRDSEPALLFHHSSRVYYWGALSGKRRGLGFDPELLYAGAMFHDMGLTPTHASAHDRFEVDGANLARTFLRSRGIGEPDVERVWTAIALHTTPGIPPHMHPVIALVTAGVEMDVLGIAFSEFSAAERDAVVDAHPRPAISRTRSSRPSTMASTASPNRPLAPSTPMCSPTRIRISRP